MRHVALVMMGIFLVAGCAPRTAVLKQLEDEARSLDSFVVSPAGQQFLGAVDRLPAVETRTIYRDSAKHHYTAEAFAALSAEDRDSLEPREYDERYYYFTRYGTPLAYARGLDLLGWETFAGRRILDFGYGGIGHLRLLASLGADVVGVEVDPLLPVLYGEPGDQGDIPGAWGVRGRLRLVHGRYPADEAVREAVGDGYDLIVSKNVLKKGYIHPQRPVDQRFLVHLGVDDAGFVGAVFDTLKPGGTFLIYNLSPAPSPPDKPYKPWSDGRCPFSRALLETTGFKVLVFDAQDSPAARRMARLLQWDQGEQPMDVDHDLFGHYTLLRKPGIVG